ncbi:ABC transporter permease [Mucilaginibacter aquariorum]|uniref:ABC transporter permease n=1 Tax=Mucilaginibacter aquariorum TaxID=2967225 RepID=A0ABT1SX91_9SPHI|nr:ABC transporter permease [Mucilaginibacter aquariorum]MCQ6956877.1 ABC transporter permease [Mucilaginibacter aquariorum]
MIKNYFKIAWRNLAKHKLFSFINVGGLAVGMAVSFMLLLYVYNEFTYDNNHTNIDRIYQVWCNQKSDGNINTGNSTPVQVAAVLKKDFPEIEKTARANGGSDNLVNYKDKSLNVSMLSADPGILDIFSYTFIKGDKKTVFKDLASVIVTESGAKAIFGDEDPMGKTFKLNNKRLVTVTGVIKDMPENSTIKFKIMGQWAMVEADQPWVKNSGWGNYAFKNYALVKEGANIKELNAKVQNIIPRYDPESKDNKLFLFPYKRIHLYSQFKNGVNTGGAIEYVRLFMFLAIGILLIACINFMNLSTARSESRAREVGVRKVVGAGRFSIIQQFMGESLFMAIISFLLSLVITTLLLSNFNSIIHKNLVIPYNQPYFWVVSLGITVLTGIIAGSYPALYLSSFKPVKVLKGVFKTGSSTLRPRQVLVIVQFVFATCLILSTILIYKQLNYIKNRPLGYDKNGLVEISQDGKIYDQFENFRRDAIATGAVIEGSATSNTIANADGASWGVLWPGQLPGEDKIPIDQMVTTYHFTSTFGVKMAEGRDFDPGRPSDSTAVMLNQSAVKLMRLKNPLGQIITWQGQKRTVVGVIKDFYWGAPGEPVKPVIVGYMKYWAGTATMRLNPALSVSNAMTKLESVYKQYNPEYPFEYKFVDELFNNKFRTEQLLGTLANSFTILAIVISCLGLFGLASFSAEQRRKEIGIRKVLGASTRALWYNLSKEFIQLVLIAFFIGAALSWYFMSEWLKNYTYHTDISVWVFAATIFISLLVTLSTVSWQAIKAALANPVKSLKSE